MLREILEKAKKEKYPRKLGSETKVELRARPEAEKPSMTYEEAMLEARKWAEGLKDRSVLAAAAYEYILALPVAVEEARMMGLPPEEGERTQLIYILANLGSWRGDVAREAKKAIRARIAELERKLGR